MHILVDDDRMWGIFFQIRKVLSIAQAAPVVDFSIVSYNVNATESNESRFKVLLSTTYFRLGRKSVKTALII